MLALSMFERAFSCTIAIATSRLQRNDMLLCHLQHNATCSKDDRDVAGEFMLELFMRDALIFMQDMPFWHEKFPDLWKIPALAPYWKPGNPVLVQWMNLQRAFVAAMEKQLEALSQPFSGNRNVRAELVNAYLAQLVGHNPASLCCDPVFKHGEGMLL